jgi:RNA polymerase sigma-70 factor (ECF subfamily)
VRPPSTDADLWARVRGDDRDAFALLFDRHSRAVYNFCFRRTGDWSLAEDLMSATFLEAWRRRDVAIESETLLPWVLGVSNNLLRNVRRTMVRNREVLARIPPLRPERDFAEDLSERLDDQARVRGILAHLGELPLDDVEILTLAAWGEPTYEALAASLGIPIGTVRSRLSRARSRLRELEDVVRHQTDEMPDSITKGAR